MPYSTPPYEETDVWERCNSEVKRSALPDSSLVGRELFVDMGLDSKLASFLSFFRATSSNQRVLLLVQLRLFLNAHT